MTKRTYRVEMRTFALVLCGSSAGSDAAWTIAHVTDTGTGRGITTMPEWREIVAPNEEPAHARACNYIDRWLLSGRGGSTAAGDWR